MSILLLQVHEQAYFLISASEGTLWDLTRLLPCCRCKNSFILHGTVECYFVFDRTSYRTGLDTLKNTEPYPGVSLNFCALQLDGGPIKTSTICFDNSGIDPNHPYVIAKVDPFCFDNCVSDGRPLSHWTVNGRSHTAFTRKTCMSYGNIGSFSKLCIPVLKVFASAGVHSCAPGHMMQGRHMLDARHAAIRGIA